MSEQLTRTDRASRIKERFGWVCLIGAAYAGIAVAGSYESYLSHENQAATFRGYGDAYAGYNDSLATADYNTAQWADDQAADALRKLDMIAGSGVLSLIGYAGSRRRTSFDTSGLGYQSTPGPEVLPNLLYGSVYLVPTISTSQQPEAGLYPGGTDAYYPLGG